MQTLFYLANHGSSSGVIHANPMLLGLDAGDVFAAGRHRSVDGTELGILDSQAVELIDGVESGADVIRRQDLRRKGGTSTENAYLMRVAILTRLHISMEFLELH